MTDTEIDWVNAWRKRANLEQALVEATRLEGYDHVQPALDHLVGYLGAYRYAGSEGFGELMSAIHHVGWLLKHKTNEVHALRLKIGTLCSSDLAAQIVKGCEFGREGVHAASFHCPVCDTLRPNQEAPGRRRGTVAVLERLCDDCVQGEGSRSVSIVRKPAVMGSLADDAHAGRSRPARSSWWRRLTTWRRHRLPAARLVEPSGRDPKGGGA